ncbi:hypothetical protein PR003_g1565 [Phytophthora rubi]|uniref:Integrase catalytic domain-containing protein n=1 Tax=Phytophthora rubi TaxID=129364 RepID=A0A6A3NGH9_9STRA|nr:hypothetical protein PR002_g10708 [Phytophthora rubi]KAE9043496.1 hypothetical protein PR001_g5772 [Phytophthora rubi]KAE9357900.1 hypothetical protein PR003_g1565 [Phytophthora rubi]
MVSAVIKENMNNKKSMELLHQRFGHMGMDRVKTLSNQCNVGIDVSGKALTVYECVACIASKAKKMSHPRLRTRKWKSLEKLVMGACKVNELTIREASMFLFVIDEATRHKWVYLLKAKSEATGYNTALPNELRTQFPKLTVRRMHSDQGGDYMSDELAVFCETRGIILQNTNSYSPEENVIAERANGVVLLRIRAMLTSTRMANMRCGEALLHVVDTLNMPLTKIFGVMSPHENLYGKAPDLSTLRTWGCVAHARVPPDSQQKK